MATVNGFTKERSQAIEDGTVVDGYVNGSHHLILVKHDGTEIDAGDVRGPAGPVYSPPPTTGRLQIAKIDRSLMRHYSAGPTIIGGLDFPWASYYRDEAGIVHLQGLFMTTASVPIGTILFTLPVGYRPAYTLRFTPVMGYGLGIILVRPNGTVSLGGSIYAPSSGTALTAGNFISLDSVHFPAEDIPGSTPAFTSLAGNLVNSWSTVGSSAGDTYAPPRAWLDSVGDLHVQGTVKKTTPVVGEAIISSIPSSLLALESDSSRIMTGSIAAGNGYNHYARLDVDLSMQGRISIGGTGNWAGLDALSLDQIIIPSAKDHSLWNDMGLTNGWVNYNSGWAPFGLYRNPIGRVYVRGLIKDGASGGITIGPQFDGGEYVGPRNHQLYPSWAGSGAARIDAIASRSEQGSLQVLGAIDGGSGFVQLANVDWDTIPR